MVSSDRFDLDTSEEHVPILEQLNLSQINDGLVQLYEDGTKSLRDIDNLSKTFGVQVTGLKAQLDTEKV